jgi:hypothetical protein
MSRIERSNEKYNRALDKELARDDIRDVSSAYCPKCSEPELEFGCCKYCGFDVGDDQQQKER